MNHDPHDTSDMSESEMPSETDVSGIASATSTNDIQAKCDEYLHGWKRALADYDNLRKNLTREKGEMRRALAEESLLSLIPVLDNFDQAFRHKPKIDDPAVQSWMMGLLAMRTQLDEVAKELGAEPFGRESESFDPMIHESLGAKKDETAADSSILEVQMRGWKMGEKIIRPAKVVINHL